MKANILTSFGSSVRASCGLDEAASWHDEVRRAVRDPVELCRILELPDHVAPDGRRAVEQFPLFVPRTYLARIEPGNPDDPLLRQVLPLPDESEEVAGFAVDPVASRSCRKPIKGAMPVPGPTMMSCACASSGRAKWFER